MWQTYYALGPDPECDKKCAYGGWCNHEKICQCLEGYMGQYCKTALCYPQCMNGGNCTSPGVCSCPSGFQGRHCEGGKLARDYEHGNNLEVSVHNNRKQNWNLNNFKISFSIYCHFWKDWFNEKIKIQVDRVK